LNDSRIRPSEDAKTKFSEGQRNSFGLTPGPEGSCPMATSGPGGCWSNGRCKTCYVWKLAQFRMNMKNNLDHNFELLKSCRGKKRVGILVGEFRRFLYECGNDDRFYRLHWSGDIFSASYARDLMEAVSEVPEVEFWNFTRNFRKDVVSCIRKLKPDNLVQYLSADACNLDRALEVYAENPETFAMSYMGHSKGPFAERWDGPVMDCPANRKHRGIEFMCRKCRMCLKGKCVFFKIRK
jgi:hypothetical protein